MTVSDCHPILTCPEAKAWETGLLPDAAAEWAAMQRAGNAIAVALEEDASEIGGLPASARLLVLAGKGNNGGDAFLATQSLFAAHPRMRVDVLLCFGEAALRPLAKRALDALRSAGENRVQTMDFAALQERRADYDVCLDGVFGFQFHPPIDAASAAVLTWVNRHPRIKLRAAVDLPSGLGETNAETVFRADFTYATGIVKAPVVADANAAFVGRVRYLDLGFFPDEASGSAVAGVGDPGQTGQPRLHPDSYVLLSSILRPLAQLRPAHTDKRTYGHLLIVGGSRSYPGAVLMAVQSALRSGVGLLTACVPESLVAEYAFHLPEAMWVGMPETRTGGLASAGLALYLEKLSRASAVAIGPGLGSEPETLSLIQELVRKTDLSLLLDADALRPEILAAAEGKRVIITPHAGELARLGGADAVFGPVGSGRGACPQAPSKTAAASVNSTGSSGTPIPADAATAGERVLVRKGSPTRVLAGGKAYVSLFGGPVLARGGSGDLLAGLTGGLLAQKPDNLWLAACRGVVWHGLAADLLARDQGQVAVQTTQLLDYLQSGLRLADHANP